MVNLSFLTHRICLIPNLLMNANRSETKGALAAEQWFDEKDEHA